MNRSIRLTILLLLLTVGCLPHHAQAQFAGVMPQPKMQFFDNNGNPLAFGRVFTYVTGTTTPLATYTSSAAFTLNTNPVILDSAGRADIWLQLTVSYRIVLQNSIGVTIWTVDNISANNGGGGGGGGSITGTGTANIVTKWTGTSAIGNSSITDTGSLITIPTATVTTNASANPGSVWGISGLVTQSASGIHVMSGSTANENDLQISTSGGALLLNARVFGTATHVPFIFRNGGAQRFSIETDGGISLYGTTGVSGIASRGVMYYDSGSNKFKCSENGGGFVDCIGGGGGGGPVTGGGTNNTVTKWTSGSTLGNSVITDNGLGVVTIAGTSATYSAPSVFVSNGTTDPVTWGLTGTIVESGSTGGLHILAGNSPNEQAIQMTVDNTSAVINIASIGTATNVPLNFNMDGTARLRINTDGGVAFPATAAPSGVAGYGVIYFDNATNVFKCSLNGAAFVNCIGSGTISGTGTTNRLPKYTAASTIGDSTITDDASAIYMSLGRLINGATSSDISGAANVTAVIGSGSGVYAASATANASTMFISTAPGAGYNSLTSGRTGSGTYLPMVFFTNNTEKMRIQTDGTVSIGTSTDSAYTLDVNGSVNASGNISTSGSFSVTNNDQGIIYSGGADWITGNGTNHTINFSTSSTERLRITSSGRVLLGLTSSDVGGDNDGQLISKRFMGVASATTNASTLTFTVVAGTSANIGSNHSGSGSDLPIIIYMGSTPAFRINTDSTICGYSNVFGLRYMMLSGGHWIDGGACP